MQSTKRMKEITENPFFQFLLSQSKKQKFDFQDDKIIIADFKDELKENVLKNRLDIKKANIANNKIIIWF